MAESLSYSEWSTEVSFMDLQVCACVYTGGETRGRRTAGARKLLLHLLAQFSAILHFACLYRLVESFI